jgi:hypothetical protein
MATESLIALEAEASEANSDAPIGPGTRVSRGHDRSRTLQIRLNVDELEELAAAADRVGLPSSTYARTVLLSSLRGPVHDAQGGEHDTRSLVRRLQADVSALAERVS